MEDLSPSNIRNQKIFTLTQMLEPLQSLIDAGCDKSGALEKFYQAIIAENAELQSARAN